MCSGDSSRARPRGGTGGHTSYCPRDQDNPSHSSQHNGTNVYLRMVHNHCSTTHSFLGANEAGACNCDNTSDEKEGKVSHSES